MNVTSRGPEGRRLFCGEVPHLSGKESDRAVQKKFGPEGERVSDRSGYPLDRDPPVRRDGSYEGVRDVRRDEGQAVSGPNDGLACAGGVAQGCGDRARRVEHDPDIAAPYPGKELDVIGLGVVLANSRKDRTPPVEHVTDECPGADPADGGRARPPGNQPCQGRQGLRSIALTFSFVPDRAREALAYGVTWTPTAQEELSHQATMMGVKPPTLSSESPTMVSPT